MKPLMCDEDKYMGCVEKLLKVYLIMQFEHVVVCCQHLCVSVLIECTVCDEI